MAYPNPFDWDAFKAALHEELRRRLADAKERLASGELDDERRGMTEEFVRRAEELLSVPDVLH